MNHLQIFKSTFCSLLILIASSYKVPTYEMSLAGHLRSKAHNNVAGLKIFMKGAVWNGEGATTDKNGDFVLNFDDADTKKPIYIYCVKSNNDTVLLKRVMKFITETSEMTFWLK